MDGGRTAYSRFKIPLNVSVGTICDIGQKTILAELIRKLSLIIWDEAPMTHRNTFETVDRTLRDLFRNEDPDNELKPFGGKTFVLGGDFRQILLIVPKKGRAAIVMASISKSYLWNSCKVFKLSKNTRLQMNNSTDASIASIRNFSDWILKLGDGSLDTYDFDNENDSSWIKIPKEFLIPSNENSVEKIVKATYPNLLKNYREEL